ncbi:mandelate racemase/muconate lactonizing enzyme family protein [Arthrobacter sp. MW3 TE3886]|uniref:mandelate racemase/muconate lactonizing enzyme family protein n=1 Tax=Arthrobacter sp. MW3 TE3886 TaxID=3156254 RepID=UPI0035137161
MEALSWWEVSLPLRRPIHHASAHEPTIDSIVVAVTVNGVIGHAEVRANGSYGTGETGEDIEDALKTCAFLGEPVRDVTDELFKRSKLASMAVDMAAWDALGKHRQQPLYQLLGAGPRQEVLTHAQIGFGSVDDAVGLASRYDGEGFRRLKVRVGSSDVSDDIDRLEGIRRVVGTKTSIVADANAGWTLDQAEAILPHLKKLGVEWLEQPVATDGELAALTATGQMRIRADESARDAASIARLAQVHAVDGVHVKLEKTGSLARLIESITAARGNGLAVAFGQFDQGRLGCAATTHVAAGLGFTKAELWGCAEISQDIAGPLTISHGAVQVPQGNGLGLSVTLPGSPKGTL